MRLIRPLCREPTRLDSVGTEIAITKKNAYEGGE
jgi:hypothetical protein